MSDCELVVDSGLETLEYEVDASGLRSLLELVVVENVVRLLYESVLANEFEVEAVGESGDRDEGFPFVPYIRSRSDLLFCIA